MTEAANRQVNIETAAITDRGLSEKRPLNEDSFFSDPQRHIFAVADGVGGANAGEVASQTAIEVLSEAFRHNLEDADIEDLMELAIQRANASIHQMAKEQPKFSMMATTVVALHLDGYRATIGHVGDSRLYRLTPDGRLHRETEDHSVVEEEVRAGRMTPAQAATHPSRNVISRALGAEDGVEVDMKTIEIDDGTVFLLCSDGITRHIPDEEIRELLSSDRAAKEICAEMKRRCYERGAEDNLTALIVRVGAQAGSASASDDDFDDERTMMASASGMERAMPGDVGGDGEAVTAPLSVPASAPQAYAAQGASAPSGVQAASRGIDRLMDDGAARSQEPQQAADEIEAGRKSAAASGAATAAARAPRRSVAGTLARLLFLLIALVLVGGIAFYAGMTYQRTKDLAKAAAAVVPAPTPVPEEPAAIFERRRREVDRDPKGAVNRLSSEAGGKPLETTDPESLYLYGRALMLSGRHAEAKDALLKSLEQLKERPLRDPLKVEAQISAIAAAFKANDYVSLRTAAADLDKLIQAEQMASESAAQQKTGAPEVTGGSSADNSNAPAQQGQAAGPTP